VTPDSTLAARWRGVATAALTTSLCIAAHAAAGGALPSGAGVVLVGVMALTLGALATTVPCAARTSVLLALLGAGQLGGHLLLGSAGHQHATSTGQPGIAMTVAHVAAVGAGAVLIAAAGRLSATLSRTVRVITATPRLPVAPARVRTFRGGDQPLRSSLQLAASVSHRGPPVVLAH
jgi:hypothetical protein